MTNQRSQCLPFLCMTAMLKYVQVLAQPPSLRSCIETKRATLSTNLMRMTVSVSVQNVLKVCQVLTILCTLICRVIFNFGTHCTRFEIRLSLKLTECEIWYIVVYGADCGEWVNESVAAVDCVNINILMLSCLLQLWHCVVLVPLVFSSVYSCRYSVLNTRDIRTGLYTCESSLVAFVDQISLEDLPLFI